MAFIRAGFAALLVLLLTGSVAHAVDSDGDGLDDGVDNCRSLANPRQLDSDGDGFGNRCDVDFNQDGIADGRDVRVFAKLLKARDSGADIDESGTIDALDAIAAIPLWGSAPGPGADPEDTDGDGVPLAQDACPQSSLGTPLLYGCSAVDLSRMASRLLVKPAIRRIANTVSKFTGPEFDAWGNAVEIETVELDTAGVELDSGDSCGAAATAGAALVRLQALSGTLAVAVGAREQRIATTFVPPGGAPGTDWEDANEFESAMLETWIAQREYERDLAALAGVVRDLGALCASITGPADVAGTIASVDPTRGELRLTDGRVLGLAEAFSLGTDPDGDPITLVSGAQVSIHGLRFADASILARHFDSASDFRFDILVQNACVDLKVVPVQLPPEFSGQPWVLHDAAAYEHDSTLFLEAGARLAVDTSGCPQPTDPLRYSTYAAEIAIHSNGVVTGRTYQDGEFLLYDSDKVTSGSRIFEVDVTTVRSDCSLAGPFDCTAPQEGFTRTYVVSVTPRFASCDARYDRTDTTLEGAPAGAFDAIEVTDFFVHTPTAQGNPTVVFSALGYPVQNGVLGPFQSIGLDESFAVFAEDIRDAWEATRDTHGAPDDDAITARIGTDGRPGLVWPRVVGQNNGAEFWYSCKLPEINRDALDICPAPALTNAFYTLPLDFAGVNQPPNGSFSHQGASAWDLPTPEGTPVFAARRGKVTFVRESVDFACTYDPSICVGNGVVIQHRDGTTASYWHLVQDGAEVAEDDEVGRGQLIGYSGNTGYSTGPHLHFQTKRPDDGFQSTLFHTWQVDLNDGSVDLRTCYEPDRGDLLLREGP